MFNSPNPRERMLAFAPWSISKADLAYKCPRAFQLKYVTRMPGQSGTAARVGTVIHRELELRLQDTAPRDARAQAAAETPDLTSVEQEDLLQFGDAVASYVARVEALRAKSKVVFEGYEVRWGIGIDGEPRPYDGTDGVLFRGSVDHLLVLDTGWAMVVDHKSGKPKPVEDYSKQLDAYAVLTVANRDDVTHVRSGIHHLKVASLDWFPHQRTRQMAQRTLVPWLKDYLLGAATALGDYQVKPQVLCGWCDYKEHCPEGKEFFEAWELSKKAKAKASSKASRERKKAAKDAASESPNDVDL